MADRHKHQPITVRLPEADRAWLTEHAGETGQTVRAIIARAVAEYRRALRQALMAGEGDQQR